MLVHLKIRKKLDLNNVQILYINTRFNLDLEYCNTHILYIY